MSGAGKILPTEEVYIGKQEKQEGVRLACQVKVKDNVDISIPEFMLDAEEYTATVTRVDDLTHDIKMIDMKIEGGKTVEFEPGQYIQLKIPGTDEFRAYSVASPPYVKDRVELAIRLVPGGLCSTYVHKALEVGDKVTFTGPFGDFFLRDTDADIIGIAGGCGMAPIRSIAYHLANLGMKRKMYYFFGARSTRDLFFTEEFKELERKYPNFKYIPALSEPKPQDKWDGEVGFITQVTEKYIHELGEKKEAYLCGPPPMIDAAAVVLTHNGVKEEDIFYDKF
jgi:Na+-transporting NADH:ubiquinone oxidoreductase subunit F